MDASRPRIVALVPSPLAAARRVTLGAIGPLALYQLARHQGLSDTSALAVGSVAPLLLVLVAWARRRHLDPVGVTALAGVGIGLVGVGLFEGSELLLKLR